MISSLIADCSTDKPWRTMAAEQLVVGWCTQEECGRAHHGGVPATVCRWRSDAHDDPEAEFETRT